MTSSSSTSGSGSGSGSLSSQSVPCSTDSSCGTLPTQDCVDAGNWSEQDDVDEQIWGKLFPVNTRKGFTLLGMWRKFLEEIKVGEY